MLIKISKINPSSEPVRTQMEPARLEELAQSIRERGPIVPIKVRPDNPETTSWVRRVNESGNDWGRVMAIEDARPKNEKYEIIYGHRRFAAYRMAGLEEVECIVEKIEKGDALVEALIENVQREDMNDADVRDALREIKERTGKTWKEVGAMFGWGKTHVRDLAALSDEEAEILRRHPDGVTKRHVVKSKPAKENSIDVLRKAAKEGLSSNQVDKVAKSIDATKDPKRKQHLIDTPYSPYTHDPEWNEERAKKYGASDPTSYDKKKTPAENWKETPSVKLLLNYIKESKEQASKVIDMDEMRKLAPEARPFVAAKIKRMLEYWEEAIKQLESEK